MANNYHVVLVHGLLGFGPKYYQWERDMDHLDICLSPEPWQIERQSRFYTKLFHRLTEL